MKVERVYKAEEKFTQPLTEDNILLSKDDITRIDALRKSTRPSTRFLIAVIDRLTK